LRYAPEEQTAYVLERILREPRVSFRALVRRRAKGFVIATFLAVLEMARQRIVHLALEAAGGEDDPADFHVERHEEMTGDVQARDVLRLGAGANGQARRHHGSEGKVRKSD
jgi:chromatin segregation and condensation protein Rec8/ScpA/Scc1 (kleisin family)